MAEYCDECDCSPCQCGRNGSERGVGTEPVFSHGGNQPALAYAEADNGVAAGVAGASNLQSGDVLSAESDDVVAPLPSGGGKAPSGKRPYRPVEYEPERPDLDRYFNEFGDFGPEIGNPERIRICRSYASYLASIEPPKRRKRSVKKEVKN